MAKVDCNVTRNFLAEMGRMCGYYGDICVSECPLSSENNGIDAFCDMFVRTCPKVAVEIVQKWSDEHPVKTRLEDLLEKYPNADIVDGRPLFYPARLGYCEYCDRCNVRGLAKECWNEPVYGGATGKAVER